MTTTAHRHDHVLARRIERRRGPGAAAPTSERGRPLASGPAHRVRERVTADAVTSAYVNEIARSTVPPAALSAAGRPGAARRLDCV